MQPTRITPSGKNRKNFVKPRSTSIIFGTKIPKQIYISDICSFSQDSVKTYQERWAIPWTCRCKVQRGLTKLFRKREQFCHAMYFLVRPITYPVVEWTTDLWLFLDSIRSLCQSSGSFVLKQRVSVSTLNYINSRCQQINKLKSLRKPWLWDIRFTYVANSLITLDDFTLIFYG